MTISKIGAQEFLNEFLTTRRARASASSANLRIRVQKDERRRKRERRKERGRQRERNRNKRRTFSSFFDTNTLSIALVEGSYQSGDDSAFSSRSAPRKSRFIQSDGTSTNRGEKLRISRATGSLLKPDDGGIFYRVRRICMSICFKFLISLSFSRKSRNFRFLFFFFN